MPADCDVKLLSQVSTEHSSEPHQEIHTFLNFLNQLISLNLKLVCSLSHHSPGISNIFFV
jgi:hypothetical protein